MRWCSYRAEGPSSRSRSTSALEATRPRSWHLLDHGSEQVRERANETIWADPTPTLRIPLPRHRKVPTGTVPDLPPARHAATDGRPLAPPERIRQPGIAKAARIRPSRPGGACVSPVALLIGRRAATPGASALRRKESWVRAGSWLSLFGTADSPGGEWALGTVGAVARLRYAVAAAWPRAWAYSASRATSASLGQRNRSPRRAAPAPARSRSAPASKVTRVGPGSAAQNSTTSLVSPDSPNAPTSPRLAVHPHGDHLPGVHVQPTRQRAYLRPPPRRGSGSCRSQRCGAGRRTRSLPRKPCTQTGRRTAPGSTSRTSTARQPPSRPVCRRP